MLKDNYKRNVTLLLKTSIMALIMSAVLSLYWTLTSAGITASSESNILILNWLLVWGESVAIALPTSLLVGPWINRCVANVISSEN